MNNHNMVYISYLNIDKKCATLEDRLLVNISFVVCGIRYYMVSIENFLSNYQEHFNLFFIRIMG